MRRPSWHRAFVLSNIALPGRMDSAAKIGRQQERTGGDHPDNVGEALHSRPCRPPGRHEYKNTGAGDRE